MSQFAHNKVEAYLQKTTTLELALQLELKKLAGMRLTVIQGSVKDFLLLLYELSQMNQKIYRQVLVETGFSEACLADLSIMELRVQDLIVNPLSKMTKMAIACFGISTLTHNEVKVDECTEVALETSLVNTMLACLADIADTIPSEVKLPGNSVLGAVVEGICASKQCAKTWSETRGCTVAEDEFYTKIESSWKALRDVINRAKEVTLVLERIDHKSRRELKYFEPIIPDFEIKHTYHLNRFKRMANWIKTSCLISNTPLIDRDMNLSRESAEIIVKVQDKLVMSTD